MQNEFSIYPHERAFEWLKKKGVGIETIGWCRNAQIEFDDILDKWWPVREGGVDAILLPVYDRQLVNVIDIVAFQPSKPGKWWLRSGVGEMLGWDIEEKRTYREPLCVHATPLEWVLSDMEGCCPLTEEADCMFLDIPEIEASPAVYERIRKTLEKRLPKRRTG